jgi:hypothetical protein
MAFLGQQQPNDLALHAGGVRVYLTKAQAESNVQDIAEDRHEANGVAVDDTYCRTQDSRQSGRGYGYSHGWVCSWTGADEDGDDVYGSFRITGLTGYYGWLPLYGATLEVTSRSTVPPGEAAPALR